MHIGAWFPLRGHVEGIHDLRSALRGGDTYSTLRMNVFALGSNVDLDSAASIAVKFPLRQSSMVLVATRNGGCFVSCSSFH